MEPFEKFNLVKKIALELQQRFTTTEINALFDSYDVEHPNEEMAQSKAVYARSALSKADIGKVLNIASGLGLRNMAADRDQITGPRIWDNEDSIRIFISHLAIEKSKATRLRDALKPFGVLAFVAHEDIEPTLEWQVQIERALHHMEVFISLHTKGFCNSVWTQQEVGFAVAKDTKIIPVRWHEDPVGFISKYQALSRGNKTAEQLAWEIDGILTNDTELSERYKNCKSKGKIPF